ncbi:MAG: prenyltransferase [Chloroflexota bacterium]
MAHYIGSRLDSRMMFLGLGWVVFIQLGSQFFSAYFDVPGDLYTLNRKLISEGFHALEPQDLRRAIAFLAGSLSLTLAASLSVVLWSEGSLSPAVVIILLFVFMGTILSSFPPVRLVTTGYGELMNSVLFANLVPALAFLLQNEEMHRLVTLTTTPLFPLYLGMLLVYELTDYTNDLRQDKRTLMVRLGWRNGMRLHNGLVLAGFILLGVSLLAGLPVRIGGPVYFVLPLGLVQIWQMRRITEGSKPQWMMLTLNSVALLMTTVYLLAYGYWVR